MDKLKPIIKLVKKYHIWVLCLVLVGVAAGGLFASTGKLDKEANTTKLMVEALDKKISTRTRAGNPPNQSFVDRKELEITAERKRIRAIWKNIYSRQQKVLVWPAAVGGNDFLQALERQANAQRLDTRDEEKFDEYTRGALKSLLEIVNAERVAAAASTPSGGKEERKRGEERQPENAISLPPVSPGFAVGWAPHSQQRINDSLVGWSLESDQRSPTTARAKRTQRDLWLYNNLLEAIAASNDGVTANYLAKVKYIVDLQVDDAVLPLIAPPPVEEKPEKKPGAAKPPAATPLPATAGRKRSPAIDVSIPVRMDLIVDQRHLSRLMAELGNADLPVEITGFVANYQSNSGKDHFDPGGGASDKKAGKGQPVLTIVDTFDMQVSIEGLVHIYKDPITSDVLRDPAPKTQP